MMSAQTESDQALERFRAYLRLLAQVNVDRALQGKLDLSGVVQQTLFEAYQMRERMCDWGDEQKAAWLRRALAHNLTDAVRKVRARGRDVLRERSLEAALERSSVQLGDWLVSPQSSPSQAFGRHEQALRVADALARLPEAQRQALVLRFWHDLKLAEIAVLVDRTPSAVAGLLHRGMEQLRTYLQGGE
jgi:RNA polymerase sigma-70 factor (ECF subfamily)